jgi:hypothetical protein
LNPDILESQLIKKPGGAHTPSSGRRDAILKRSVRSNDDNVSPVTDLYLRNDGIDDRVISRSRGMYGAQAAVLPGRDAPPGGALENQDDLVIGQRRCRQLVVQPTGSPRAITPPTVGATAHDVCAIDDQDLHSDSVGEASEHGTSGAKFKIA